MNNPLVTIIIPIFGRPLGTKNIILDLTNQTLNQWEAILVIDGCKEFDKILLQQEVICAISTAIGRGNTIKIHKFPENKGGFGYAGINYGIENSTGKYITFAANDDRISPYHLENYMYPIINGIDADLIFFSSLVATESKSFKRTPEFKLGGVGHSEMLIKSSIAKKLPPHTHEYGHDWTFIKNAIQESDTVFIDNRDIATYIVRRLREDSDENLIT